MKNLYRKALLTIILTAVALSGCVITNGQYRYQRIGWTDAPSGVLEHSAQLDQENSFLQERRCRYENAERLMGRALAQKEHENGIEQRLVVFGNADFCEAYAQEWDNLRQQDKSQREDLARKRGINRALKNYPPGW